MESPNGAFICVPLPRTASSTIYSFSLSTKNDENKSSAIKGFTHWFPIEKSRWNVQAKNIAQFQPVENATVWVRVP